MKQLLVTFLAFSISACGMGSIRVKKDTTLSFEMDQRLKEVLYYASLAPSGHNSQMWRVNADLKKGEFYILIDESRKLNEVDPNFRESYISIGAFLENMRRAFAAYNSTTEIEIFGDARVDKVLATVRYSSGSTVMKDESALKLIEKRHTDKRNFDNVELPSVVLSKILTNNPNLRYYPKGSPEFQYIATESVATMMKQANEQNKRDELAKWLRFSDKEALAKKDGLPAEQLGIKGIKKAFYYIFVNEKYAKSDAFANESIKLIKNQTTNCSGFFIITGEDSASGYIKAGIDFESFSLDAAENDILIQPISQMLEETTSISEVKEKLSLTGTPQMIIRAGVTKNYGKNNKIRRNLAEFVYIYE